MKKLKKNGRCSKPLVSYEISDKEEIETILVKNKIRKKVLISDSSNLYKCYKICLIKSHQSQYLVIKF